jgi:hypothetical protein
MELYSDSTHRLISNKISRNGRISETQEQEYNDEDELFVTAPAEQTLQFT